MTALPRQTVQLKPEPLDGISDEQLRLAGRRKAIVESWRRMCDDFKAADRTKADATKVFLAAHSDITARTLYRWHRQLTEGGMAALLDGRSTAVRNAAPDPVDPDAWERFKQLYLTIQRRPVTLCYQIVAAEAAEHHWSFSALRTIQRKVQRELPPFHANYFRLGQRQWHRKYGPKLRRDYTKMRSNEWWVGDFKKADVFCRKSDADPTIIRPLISAFLDMRSRMNVGRCVCLSENSDTVLIAFRKGVEQYGSPHHAILDNGKPYRSRGVSGGRPSGGPIRQAEARFDEDYMRSVFGGLNVAVHFSIPFNPDSKPIERWFRTLDLQFAATYESYCGGEKDDLFRHAAKFAKQHPDRCPTVAEFAASLDRWAETYHAIPHRGYEMNNLSPRQAFDQFNPIPRAIAPEGALDVLLMRTTRPVKVMCNGVRYQSIEYGVGNAHLMPLQGNEVLLRVHPEDASFVVVCDLDGKPICKATNNRLAMHGVTQEHVKDGMKRRKKARELAKSVRQGGLKPSGQDVTEAAIRARHAEGQRRQEQQLAATGTEDVAPRNVTPLRSDFTEAIDKFNQRLLQPAEPVASMPSLDALDHLLDEVVDTTDRFDVLPDLDRLDP